MYFLRWLTGHPAMLIVLITGVYALINWSNLYHWFGDENVGAEHALEMTHEAPAVDSMSGMQGMDGMSGMNGMQGMAGMSGMSGMQGMDGMSRYEWNAGDGRTIR